MANLQKRDFEDTIDLTLDEDDIITSRTTKRQQGTNEVQSVASTSSGRTTVLGGDDRQQPPFSLLHVRDIPTWANEGFLGTKFSHLVSGDIKLAVISNYMIDFPWLLSACPALLSAEKLVILHGEKGQRATSIVEDAKAAGLTTTDGRIVVHAPPIPISYGVHHSKAFILQYGTGVRVVIHTANLVYVDGNNKSQGVYTQDFPLKDTQSPQTSPFERDLLEYINQLHLPPTIARTITQMLSLHDFSPARASLIASVPGYHTGDKLRSWGHLKLRDILNNCPGGFESEFSNAPVLAQFSSLGSLDQKWLDDFTASLSAGSADGQRLGLPPAGPAGLKIVWPTVSEVQNSIDGWFSGCSIPGAGKNVNKPFLQPYYCKWGGEPCGRQRAMPHIKTFTRYKTDGTGEAKLAWWIVGSHNLSKAAWGEVQKNGTQFMMRHYELGAVLLPGLELAYQKSRWRGFSCTNNNNNTTNNILENSEIERNDLEEQKRQKMLDSCTKVRFVQWQKGNPQTAAFQENPDNSTTLIVPIPVPYVLPPQSYDGREDIPWAIDGQWPGLDTWGRPKSRPRGVYYGVTEGMDWVQIVISIG